MRRAAAWPLVLALLGLVAVPARAELAPPPTPVDWRDQPPAGWPDPPPATATSYVLMDAATGQVLAAREPDEPRAVASTVKLLTILTAMQRLEPDQRIVVGPAAVPGVGGAGASVDPGETWSVPDLVDAIILRSGNDAARALAAAAAGGDLDAFADEMEDTAAALGLDDVVITEPTGLADANRLSARALATIARVALQQPLIRAAARKDTARLPDLGVVPNRNLLIGRYRGATGLKTGHTDLAGWCLVASARRDGRELIAVVLGAREDPDRFSEAAALLDHGFTALASTPMPALQARVAGGWTRLLPDQRAWAPQGSDVAIELARRQAPGALVVTPRADGTALGVATVAVPAPQASGVGALLANQAYRAMRQAHVTGTWPDLDSSG